MVLSSICMNMPTITQVTAMRSASGESRCGAWKKGVGVVVDNSGVPRTHANTAAGTAKSSLEEDAWQTPKKVFPSPPRGEGATGLIAIARGEDLERFCNLRAEGGWAQNLHLFAQPQHVPYAEIEAFH